MSFILCLIRKGFETACQSSYVMTVKVSGEDWSKGKELGVRLIKRFVLGSCIVKKVRNFMWNPLAAKAKREMW